MASGSASTDDSDQVSMILGLVSQLSEEGKNKVGRGLFDMLERPETCHSLDNRLNKVRKKLEHKIKFGDDAVRTKKVNPVVVDADRNKLKSEPLGWGDWTYDGEQSKTSKHCQGLGSAADDVSGRRIKKETA